MSDLQCPARILLARPALDASRLATLRAQEHVARVIEQPHGVDLEEVADLHRGETVLVVTDSGPHVDRGRDVLLVEIDADGWRFTEVAPPQPDLQT